MVRQLSLWTCAAFVLLALVVSFGPIAGADESQPCPSTYFDTTQLTDEQRAWTQEALARLWFLCQRFEPGLTSRGVEKIAVATEDLPGYRGENREGLAIVMDPAQGRGVWIETFLHELGHSIDYLYLTDSDRAEIMRVFDSGCWFEGCGYPKRAGEAFADAFVRGFSDVDTAQGGCPPSAPRKACRTPKTFPTWQRVNQISEIVML